MKVIVTVCFITKAKIKKEKEVLNMAIVHLTRDNFEAEIANAKGKSLIDFWASWCGPCQMIAPVIEEIAEEQENVKICKVNVDEQPELAQMFGISSIPTLVVIEDGKLVDHAVGARPKEDILAMIG